MSPQAPRRHLPMGSHSAPKCPFPRPAAAERRGCGSGGAGGGTCSWRPSPGGGQTWRVRRVPNFSGVWLQPVNQRRRSALRENPVPKWGPPRLVPSYFIPCTPTRLSSSHSLESSVCPGGDWPHRRCLGPHFPLAPRLTPLTPAAQAWTQGTSTLEPRWVLFCFILNHRLNL